MWDQYSRRARLTPAVIAVLPAAFVALGWSPLTADVWRGVWGLVVVSGGTALLAQVGRDLGKRKEGVLFRMWGGRPSERYLSHDGPANALQRARWHQRLRDLAPHLSIPTEAEERRNPFQAHQQYEACTAWVISQTRDVGRFQLLFLENCNYGFRRNLWGLKVIGLPLAGVATALLSYRVYAAQTAATGSHLTTIAFACASGVLFLLWCLWITPSWVRIPADEYGRRLCEALEQL